MHNTEDISSIPVAQLVTWNIKNDPFQSSYWSLTICGRLNHVCSTDIEIARITAVHRKDGLFIIFVPHLIALLDVFYINDVAYVFDNKKSPCRSAHLSQVMRSIESKIKLK